MLSKNFIIYLRILKPVSEDQAYIYIIFFIISTEVIIQQQLMEIQFHMSRSVDLKGVKFAQFK